MFSIRVLNLPESPLRLMGLSHLVIIYNSCTPRRNDQTSFSDGKSKLESQSLSVSGYCHKMAGALRITHPINIFSLNFFNYNLIILPTCHHHLQHLFDSHSIYITTIKHHCKFKLYLNFLHVVEFKFFLISWNQRNISNFPEIYILLMMTKVIFNGFQRA